jgi:hypothetical protein
VCRTLYSDRGASRGTGRLGRVATEGPELRDAARVRDREAQSRAHVRPAVGADQPEHHVVQPGCPGPVADRPERRPGHAPLLAHRADRPGLHVEGDDAEGAQLGEAGVTVDPLVRRPDHARGRRAADRHWPVGRLGRAVDHDLRDHDVADGKRRVDRARHADDDEVVDAVRVEEPLGRPARQLRPDPRRDGNDVDAAGCAGPHAVAVLAPEAERLDEGPQLRGHRRHHRHAPAHVSASPPPAEVPRP